MGRHSREPNTDAADHRTAARRRLDLLGHELGGGGPDVPSGQAADDLADELEDDLEDELAERPPPEPAPRLSAASGRHRAAALPARARVTGAARDQLPGPLRRASAERGVTGQHVTVVALLVAVLLCAGAWWVLSGRPVQRAVEPVVQPPGVPARSAPSPDATAPYGAAAGPDGAPPDAAATQESVAATVVVDVAGRVRRPGLVTLPAGARVADALESAGGTRPRVDLATLNLARPLVDGEQLLVGVRTLPAPTSVPGAAAPVPPPVVPTPGAVTSPGAVGTLVNLNTATLVELDTLPGIGPVTGQAILDWRTANGSFTSVDELLEVDGIGDATLADLRDLVTV